MIHEMWVVFFGLIVLICFGGVVLFGAPYLPTLNPQVKVALEVSGLKPGDTLLELGCGDGKVLLAAAKLGINGVGYELNPILALVAWLRTRRYRKYIKIIWGDFWRMHWPNCDAIFVFLLARYMNKLDTKIKDLPHKPVTLISFAFQVPNKPVVREKQGVFIYIYD